MNIVPLTVRTFAEASHVISPAAVLHEYELAPVRLKSEPTLLLRLLGSGFDGGAWSLSKVGGTPVFVIVHG
jgi:hypothetical protein